MTADFFSTAFSLLLGYIVSTLHDVVLMGFAVCQIRKRALFEKDLLTFRDRIFRLPRILHNNMRVINRRLLRILLCDECMICTKAIWSIDDSIQSRFYMYTYVPDQCQ